MIFTFFSKSTFCNWCTMCSQNVWPQRLGQISRPTGWHQDNNDGIHGTGQITGYTQILNTTFRIFSTTIFVPIYRKYTICFIGIFTVLIRFQHEVQYIDNTHNKNCMFLDKSRNPHKVICLTYFNTTCTILNRMNRTLIGFTISEQEN